MMNLIFKILWLCPLIVICFGDFHLKSTADRDLTEEIDAFDSLLGRYLNIYQQNQWNSLILGHHSLIDQSNVQKLRRKFIANLLNWSSNRLRRNCIGRNGQNQEKCRYLSEIQRVFGDGSNNDNSMRQFNHMKQLLTRKIEQIDYNHHGKEYRCDESMDSLMETMDDPQELMNIWQNCHQQLGQWPIPELFTRIHQLMVNGNHFKEFWNHMNADLRLGTIDQIHSKALNVWNRLKSFYDLLIDYIGHRLRGKYSNSDGQFDADHFETIPAHWLRSLNGGQMDSIIDLVLPYKEIDHDHRTDSNTIKIVTDFYVKHAGFGPLPRKFWQNSNLISHPNGSCYPCTMNMYDHDDIRMNICLETSHNNNNRYNLRRLFHEIGHVYYYLQSSKHRNLYQMTTNSAIHESIGELMRLSYQSCRLNQMKNFVHRKRYEQLKVNALIKEALSSFVMLPYALVLEQWRHQTFSTENMTIHESNKLYWHLRREIQRIGQPNGEDNDHQRILDPLLKHHAANFQSYWRYYFGIIVQHRFYQRLCENQSSSSLIDCCPSNFELLRKFLTIDLMHPNHDDQIVIEQMFSSQNDPINSYDAEPIINYYRPLIDWLTQWKLNLMN